jgi:hypothetical protein
MTFRTDSAARKYVRRVGVAAATWVVAFHLCPTVDEHVLVPADHTTHHDYHPISVNALDIMASTSPGGLLNE